MKQLAIGVALALVIVVALVLVVREGRGSAGDEGGSPSASAPREALRADEPEARERASGEAALQGERIVLVSEARALDLVLLRSADEVPIARSAVDVEPLLSAEDAGPWLETDDAGKLAVSMPGGTSAVRVDAEAFEPQDLALVPGTSGYRLLLLPSNGLFGRVVRGDGEPIAGAEVRLETVEVMLQIRRSVDGEATEFLPVYRRAQLEARARTNERGQYYLPHRTRATRGEVRVVAQVDADSAALAVRLPREPVALDDLVLERDRGLCVRVVDETGLPVPGARLSSPENPGSWGTDDRGELRLRDWNFPAYVRANAVGRRMLGLRAPDGTLVENPRLAGTEGQVVIVLESPFALRARVLDRDTRIPIGMSHGRVEFLVDGEITADRAFQTDLEGLAWIPMSPSEDDSQEACDLARIRLEKEGYRGDVFVEVDLPVRAPEEPIEILLEPESGALVLRGTVLREGIPDARCELGLRTWIPSGEPEPKTWRYTRNRADGAGRFTFPWKPSSPEEVAVLRPHRGDGDEFGLLGPLRADTVGTDELVLDIRRGRSVPVIVRGIESTSRCTFHLSIVREGLESRVTTNGIALPLADGPELRARLHVPAGERVKVALGITTHDAVYANGPSVYLGPEPTASPLVFDAPRAIFAVRGRIEGFTPEELAGLLVCAGITRDSSATVTEPAPGGTFGFADLVRNHYELFLLRPAEGGCFEPLGRLVLDLDADREGIVLRADPTSLTEEE